MSREELPGVYVHVPFCRTKCPYCDFYSETCLSLIPAWLNALEKEIIQYKGRFDCFDTLYIGGGTPTVLDPTSLRLLIECLMQHCAFDQGIEFTIEANPGDITHDKLSILRDLGVNRISLGIQSFNDAELAMLRRRHSAEEAERSLDLIRSCGFENVAVDLIYGIPGQTLNGWVKTLNRAVTYNPEHISCYQLTIAGGTPFRQMEQSGGIKLPEELESTALFLTTSELLEESGYLHYEVSNFARAERYLSRHNQKYWRHVSYLGLGPAAHSFHHGARWWNYRSIKQYCQAIEVGYTPVEETENLSEEQLFLEVLYLGLRTRAGLAISQVQKNEHYGTVLSGLVHDQYLEIVNDRVMPTRKGFLVADRLPLALM